MMLLQVVAIVSLLCFGLASPTITTTTTENPIEDANRAIMDFLMEFKEEMKNELHTIKSEMSNLSSKVDNVEKNVEKKVAQLDEKMTLQIGNLQSNITHVEKEMTSQIGNLQSNITHVESDVNILIKYATGVFYPYGTTDHFAKRFYEEYKVTFIGYGDASSFEDYVSKYDVTLESCLSWCNNKRQQQGTTYNGVTYFTSRRKCDCIKADVGHTVEHDALHYRFV